MNSRYLNGIYLRLASAIMFFVIAALAVNAYLSHHAFERALAPEMAKKVATVGASVRALILRSVEFQFDFSELQGIEQVFDEVRKESPEIAYLAVTDTEGRILRQLMHGPSGAEAFFKRPEVLAVLEQPERVPPAVRIDDQYIVSLPIVAAQGPLGMLHLGLDVGFVDHIVLEMLFDVVIVLVVSLFFTLELLNFMAGAKLESALRALGDAFERGAGGSFATPARHPGAQAFASAVQLLEGVLARVNAAYEQLARDVEAARRVPAHERPPMLAGVQARVVALGQRYRFGQAAAQRKGDETELARIRAPLFLFILAEELTRPFLPGYVKSLLVPIPWLSPQIIVGLPIALFMLIVALAQPVLGVYAERHGSRRTMFIGAAVAAAGFLLSAFAGSVLDLLLWRSMCAVGYAMVFVAGQSYVLEHASPNNRARSFSLFVGAIMVASICGPSIGGILADNIGERTTLGVAALLALGSLAAIRLLPDAQRRDTSLPSARVPHWSEIATLLTNRRFMTVTGLAAMPAKILLTGVCFYLVPLYVLASGSTQAMAGRMLMTYAVLMVVAAPLTAALATSRERMEWLVGGGLVVSGLGGLMLLAGGRPVFVFAAVALIGLGQSMSISAQSALVSEHCEAEILRIGEGAVYGVYRLLERLGNAAGPMLAAGLVMAYDYRAAFVTIGAAVLCCGVLFLASTRRAQRALPVAA